MPTSFTRTRLQIAQRVAQKVLKIGRNQSVSSADADTIYEELDLQLKRLHTRGIFWRKVTSVPVTFSLSASIATASAGAGDILFPVKATFRNGTNDDPLTFIDYRQYAEIEDKSRSGNPEKIMWKGGSEFVLYPVPGTDGTAKLLYEKIADDTSAGAAIDVDVAMIGPMIDIVKYYVADDYGVEESVVRRWAAEAQVAERDIRKLNAQKVDYAPVAVDDFDNRQPNSRRATDYDW